MYNADDSNDRIISVVRLALQEVQWCQTKQSLRKHKCHVLFQLFIIFPQTEKQHFWLFVHWCAQLAVLFSIVACVCFLCTHLQKFK